MKTTVITLAMANKKGCTWEDENACEFHGVIPGYVCGFCVEITNGNEIHYTDCTFTNDYEEIRNPWFHKDWNYLGLAVDGCSADWKPTGNIMFRGYFREDYDWEERDFCYTDASFEALDLLSKYMDVIKTHSEVVKRWVKC